MFTRKKFVSCSLVASICFLFLSLSSLEAVSREEVEIGPGLPRSETIVLEAFPVPDPYNFNIWAGFASSPARGTHQFVAESVWFMDRTGLINGLAKEPPIYNDDFTKMTIELRKGIYWNDDVEFTADDIVWSIEKEMKTLGMAYNTTFNLAVEKVYKTGDYTVVFELKKPNSRFHNHFMDRWICWRPMPKHIFEKVENIMKFKFYPPVSLGQYVLTDLDPAGNWTVWQKRKDWERTVAGKLYGEPKPKYVIFANYGPAEKKVMAIMGHELDWSVLTMEALRVVMDKNPYARSYYKEFPYAVTLEPATPSVVFNCDKYPFNIKDVRWALTLAIDIADVIMASYDGSAAMSAFSNVSPGLNEYKWYFEPMEDWMRNFTLDIQYKGEPFHVYDTSAPIKLAERCRERGYPVPDNLEEVKKRWGYGWYKYQPEVAKQLLERNGFKQDKDGKWLLPNGKPWKITLTSDPFKESAPFRLSFPIVEQWRRFGIDASVETNINLYSLMEFGDFETVLSWSVGSWSGIPDQHRILEHWHSKYFKPIGESMPLGFRARWTDDRLDSIIDEMESIASDDPRILELGKKALRIFVENRPTIPLVAFPSVVAWDEYWWTGFPVAENPYITPHCHWPSTKFAFPQLEPVEEAR